MSKNRFKKIKITDVAINKVPLIKYPILTNKQNKDMQRLAKEVLIISKSMNNSNEVAITCDIGKMSNIKDYGVCLGKEHEVQIGADTKSNHILLSSSSCLVTVLHNHPSLQTFSLDDIYFLIVYHNVKIFTVITNYSNIHYLVKSKKYSYNLARKLFIECLKSIKRKKSVNDRYYAAVLFLARASEAGLIYF